MKQVTNSIWQIKQVRQNLSTRSLTVPKHNPLYSFALALAQAQPSPCLADLQAAESGQRQPLQAPVPYSLQPCMKCVTPAARSHEKLEAR
jgi:hypothetical protein